jgi:hypothetical protein
MDAGVPISKHVAGISTGLVTEMDADGQNSLSMSFLPILLELKITLATWTSRYVVPEMA